MHSSSCLLALSASPSKSFECVWLWFLKTVSSCFRLFGDRVRVFASGLGDPVIFGETGEKTCVTCSALIHFAKCAEWRMPMIASSVFQTLPCLVIETSKEVDHLVLQGLSLCGGWSRVSEKAVDDSADLVFSVVCIFLFCGRRA